MSYTWLAGLAHPAAPAQPTCSAPSPAGLDAARAPNEDEMISQPAHQRPSTLPDYYGDERRALVRVRVRRSVRWLGVVVAAATLLAWRAGR